MKQIIGEIDGKKSTGIGTAEVIEQNPNHFLVSSEEKTLEIFLASSGSLSDGNSIDNIEVTTETEKESITRERFAKYQSGANLKGSTKGMILKASMPGMVRAVSVKVGDSVQKNTQVLVLEAMKMENSITAGFTGLVFKILVEPGMSVEKSAPLIEFRPPE